MSEQKTGIGGKRRENLFDNQLHVGLAEVEVIAINPTTEEYKELLGIDLKEDSKATEYIGESSNGNTTVRVDFWVQRELKKKEGETEKKFKRDKITFFLEDKPRENKEETKKQYINELGSCSWADDPNNLPEWFVSRDYRIAYNGEEDFYNLLRSWLAFDYRDASTILSLEWKKVMKNDFREIKSLIGSDIATKFGALYTVKTVDKDGDVKEYQSIYNKMFVPTYALKQFRLVDYSKDDVLEGLKKKKSKELKPYERFVLNVRGEHGCKDSYLLKDIKEYNPDDFLVASDEPLQNDDPAY